MAVAIEQPREVKLDGNILEYVLVGFLWQKFESSRRPRYTALTPHTWKEVQNNKIRFQTIKYTISNRPFKLYTSKKRTLLGTVLFESDIWERLLFEWVRGIRIKVLETFFFLTRFEGGYIWHSVWRGSPSISMSPGNRQTRQGLRAHKLRELRVRGIITRARHVDLLWWVVDRETLTALLKEGSVDLPSYTIGLERVHGLCR
jgi:hypothetical protein